MRAFVDDDDDEVTAIAYRVRGVTVERDTGKALLCRWPNGSQYWIPKSMIADESEVFDARDHSKGEIAIAYWWARKNGIAREFSR